MKYQSLSQPQFMDFYSRAHPHAFRISAPVTTDFLLRSLRRRPLLKSPGDLLVRDGMSSLAAFFRNWPEPPDDMNARLIIAAEAAPLVPRYWRNKVDFFSYAQALNTPPVRRVVALVSGPADSRKLQQFDEKRRQYLREYPEAMFLVVFVPPQASQPQDWLITPDIEITSWAQYSWSPHFRFDAIFRIGFEDWTLDSWCTHLVMSRQGRVVDTFSCPQDGTVYPVSLRHGYFVFQNADFTRRLPIDLDSSYNDFYQEWQGSV